MRKAIFSLLLLSTLSAPVQAIENNSFVMNSVSSACISKDGLPQVDLANSNHRMIKTWSQPIVAVDSFAGTLSDPIGKITRFTAILLPM